MIELAATWCTKNGDWQPEGLAPNDLFSKRIIHSTMKSYIYTIAAAVLLAGADAARYAASIEVNQFQ